MQYKFIILLLFLGISSTALKAQLTEDERFEISKNLDIINSVFKELNLNYVDTLDVEKITRNTINSMLHRLDPYTEFIPEEEVSTFLQQTTGEYGGVGSIISYRTDSNHIYIVDPYEGMPAQLAGMQAGDVLLEIDGISMEGQTSNFASEKLRGQPNTKIKVKFQRYGEKKPREVTFERKRIEMDPITYYGVLPGNIGYIYFYNFTTHSAENIRKALDDLVNKQGIQSLILDVRDNGGGVVEDCMEILNNFIPKGELLLTMKGKHPQSDRVYRTTQDPAYPNIPIAVLTNRGSASASEILAGAIQDFDRGVVIGNRTYGKGLVQSSKQLPYNARIKMTTAKYYIPSGRCIQAVDYSHRNEDGSVSYIPDSLTTVFYTKNGRPVKDGGGVSPDFVVEEKQIPTIAYYMDAQNIFFDFVVQWRARNPKIALPQDFVLSDEDYNEFKEFVKSKDFTYDRQSEKALASLKEIMEFENYFSSASEEFAALENKLKPDLDRDLELYKEQLSQYLSLFIMKHYYYAKGEQIYSIRGDQVVEKAIEVLSNPELYRQTLEAGD